MGSLKVLYYKFRNFRKTIEKKICEIKYERIEDQRKMEKLKKIVIA